VFQGFFEVSRFASEQPVRENSMSWMKIPLAQERDRISE
jgi:hypothetical protein